MKRVKVSTNVIRRLPRYLRKLDELEASGVVRISSFDLGQQLGLTPSQIRQDFSCFGEFGQQGYGYNVATLRAQIASILGMDRGYRAILIGVGNIGHALMDNFSFADCGVTLTAAFDIRESLIGTEVQGVPVLSADTLEEYLKTQEVDLAVLAVSKEVAVKVTEILSENGVEAVWNFTNIELTEPNSSMMVENVHFSDSLLSLSYYISERQDEKAAKAARSDRSEKA
ncbi:MAG: redox-sensing transcriptional repressor Rex [Oscillospiraceae bacterium]|nr:redox-sensing transcriptional repressor Rex [Oscillospiraceae bacterium]